MKAKTNASIPPDSSMPLILIAGAIVLFSILIFCIGPEMIRSRMAGWPLDNNNPVGDTFSGTVSPLIAWMAALLTFLAFWVQYRSNLSQQQQFKKQADDIALQRFDTKFYKLLSLHKENLHEISISGYQGNITLRKAFVSMYKEFRYCFFVVKNKYLDLKKANGLAKDYTDSDLLRLAYIFFYSGVGIHSNKVNKSMSQDYEESFVEEVRKSLGELREGFKNKKVADLSLDGLDDAVLPNTYRPFEGHMSRLGYYYRHLFQTVKYVVDQEEIIDEDDKYEYLRTVRAQLSDHEQVMLYYNAVVEFGGAWIRNGYFTTYRMIHNLPLPLADFGERPEEKFKNDIESLSKKGIAMFEWMEG